MDTEQTDGPFDEPVHLAEAGSNPTTVLSAKQAYARLSDVNWPGPRNVRHEQAAETCLKVLEGHRNPVDARRALVDVAREAGILEGS
jgi:hypothetical protein